MRRRYLIFLLILMFQNITAQDGLKKPKFIPPLDIPLHVSGNFAELRADHFHSGVDFRTQGVTGKKVFSIDKGYVSRIKVQANGYGKSVYINHPGGYTSVYGHLLNYNTRIDQYVKKYQYAHKTHTLDIYPGKDEIPIEAGEIIALSGNSGSSGGPHLHFEIRRTADQHPLNVLDFGYDISDSKPPRVMGLYLYSFTATDNRRMVCERRKTDLIQQSGVYKAGLNSPVKFHSPSGIGIEGYDFLDGTNNRCGIYNLELFADGVLLYRLCTDEFSFAESRYINSNTDYELKQEEDLRIYNLFRRPNNELSMVKFNLNNGILIPEPGKKYNLEIKLTDVQGNQTRLEIFMEGATASGCPETAEPEGVHFYWDTENLMEKPDLSFILPEKSLYEDAFIGYEKMNGGTGVYPYEISLGRKGIPMHKAGELMIRLEAKVSNPDKLVIVKKDEKGNWKSEGGELTGDSWIKTRISQFGIFSIESDTIAPEIKALNLNSNGNLNGSQGIRFSVNDKLSAISEYKAFIDNEWVLLEYDPKNSLLYYEFDKSRLKQGIKHEIEIYVTDEKGNTSAFHGMFSW